MLSQSDLVESRSGRLVGVRGGAVRSSERRAIVSSVGRLVSDEWGLWGGGGGGCAYGEGRSVCWMDARALHLRRVGRTTTGKVGSAAAIAALRDALRSFWRRF
jgi:hypothetical protein